MNTDKIEELGMALLPWFYMALVLFVFVGVCVVIVVAITHLN